MEESSDKERPVFPEGATYRVLDQSDAASATHLVPEGLVFEPASTTEMVGGQLHLMGTLHNSTDDDVEMVMFPYSWPHPNPFTIKFTPESPVKQRPCNGPPRPPPVPPPPVTVDVKAGARIFFRCAIDLHLYEFNPGARVIVEWTFWFWSEPRPTGRLEAILP